MKTYAIILLEYQLYYKASKKKKIKIFISKQTAYMLQEEIKKSCSFERKFSAIYKAPVLQALAKLYL